MLYTYIIYTQAHICVYAYFLHYYYMAKCQALKKGSLVLIELSIIKEINKST